MQVRPFRRDSSESANLTKSHWSVNSQLTVLVAQVKYLSLERGFGTWSHPKIWFPVIELLVIYHGNVTYVRAQLATHPSCNVMQVVLNAPMVRIIYKVLYFYKIQFLMVWERSTYVLAEDWIRKLCRNYYFPWWSIFKKVLDILPNLFFWFPNYLIRNFWLQIFSKINPPSLSSSSFIYLW